MHFPKRLYLQRVPYSKILSWLPTVLEAKSKLLHLQLGGPAWYLEAPPRQPSTPEKGVSLLPTQKSQTGTLTSLPRAFSPSRTPPNSAQLLESRPSLKLHHQPQVPREDFAPLTRTHLSPSPTHLWLPVNTEAQL